ncbi:DUF898 family protein [Geobacter hydrogenophilus]|uniref:Membrane protein n=1 Tax=Geobacter hydrogenophilus TaxID=40983 RepID=A0A9W6LBQ5_9BACT|nr:DUF898 family protein [Geobacter hydrogenophilus]MBT0893856.1 DUF898 family protein [Geobacter hydrogenophilus]GLI38202.1 membrane protein [Geobacter hydrogenophilus]
METVSCPHCSLTKEMPAGTIPDGARVRCPRCGERFTYSRGTGPKASESIPAAASPPGAVPPRPPALPEPRRPAAPRTLRFTFTGTAKEYFGIWIVNTLLKIVTLGAYSAWAKVRKRRYFYGNTLLDGSPFDYLADPKALFRGWLIGALAFLVYTAGTRYTPGVAKILGFVFFLTVPWLVVRSRLFNCRNSRYRNLRFAFRDDYQEAYVIFAGLAFLVPFTLGLIFPYLIYRQKKFLVEKSSYGRTPFTFTATGKDYYFLFLKAAGWLVLLLVVVMPAAFYVASTLAEGGALLAGADLRRTQMMVGALMFFALPVLYLFIVVYVQTALANLTWNSTNISGSRFVSRMRVRDMAWLYLSNAAAIIASLGLMAPWASVRLARYRFDTLSVEGIADMEAFRAGFQADVGAAGEEIGDIFGIDVAL